MRPAQVVSKLKKMVGKRYWYRQNDMAPDAVGRGDALASLPGLRAAEAAAKEAVEAKRAALLADPEYVALSAAYKAARDQREKAAGLAFFYRIELGRTDGIGIYVLAHGDTYDEAFKALADRVVQP